MDINRHFIALFFTMIANNLLAMQGVIRPGHIEEDVERLLQQPTGDAFFLHTSCPHDNWVCSVAFDPTGNRLATGSYDSNARIFDLNTGQIVRCYSHDEYVHSIAFDPTGGRLATGSGDGKARIFDLTSGSVLQTYRHDNWVRSVAF